MILTMSLTRIITFNPPESKNQPNFDISLYDTNQTVPGIQVDQALSRLLHPLGQQTNQVGTLAMKWTDAFFLDRYFQRHFRHERLYLHTTDITCNFQDLTKLNRLLKSAAQTDHPIDELPLTNVESSTDLTYRSQLSKTSWFIALETNSMTQLINAGLVNGIDSRAATNSLSVVYRYEATEG